MSGINNFKICFFLTCCIYVADLQADTIPGLNKHNHLKAGVFMDMYYGYSSPVPKSENRSYFVSHARHNEVQVNLACIEMKLNYPDFRASFVPGSGTYMDANYAAEPAALRNIVEAMAGFRLHKRYDMWLDAGVLPSPYTNESAFSSDQLLYTRSMGPENTPYYVTGARLGFRPFPGLLAELYILNGWQKIRLAEKVPAFGSKMEYRPDKRWTLNWNTYIGNEQDKGAANLGMRYFSDVYVIYYRADDLKIASSIYGGLQERSDSLGKAGLYSWWQANLMAWQKLSRRTALSGRIEIFSDPYSVMIQPFTTLSGFTCFSGSLCLNFQMTDKVVLRLEGRSFRADGKKFDTISGHVSKTLLFVGGLTARY